MRKKPAKSDAFGGNRSEEDRGMLWIGAFRYYCGRQSYAVSWFCEIIVREWATLPKRARAIIQRDLEKEFELDDRFRATGEGWKTLGADIDRREWEKVRALWQK